jgi:hypothetical protein
LVEIRYFVRLRRTATPAAAAEDNAIIAMISMLSGIFESGFGTGWFVIYPQLSGTSGLSIMSNCSKRANSIKLEWGLWVSWWGRWDLNPRQMEMSSTISHFFLLARAIKATCLRILQTRFLKTYYDRS